MRNSRAGVLSRHLRQGRGAFTISDHWMLGRGKGITIFDHLSQGGGEGRGRGNTVVSHQIVSRRFEGCWSLVLVVLVAITCVSMLSVLSVGRG